MSEIQIFYGDENDNGGDKCDHGIAVMERPNMRPAALPSVREFESEVDGLMGRESVSIESVRIDASKSPQKIIADVGFSREKLCANATDSKPSSAKTLEMVITCCTVMEKNCREIGKLADQLYWKVGGNAELCIELSGLLKEIFLDAAENAQQAQRAAINPKDDEADVGQVDRAGDVKPERSSIGEKNETGSQSGSQNLAGGSTRATPDPRVATWRNWDAAAIDVLDGRDFVELKKIAFPGRTDVKLGEFANLHLDDEERAADERVLPVELGEKLRAGLQASWDRFCKIHPLPKIKDTDLSSLAAPSAEPTSPPVTLTAPAATIATHRAPPWKTIHTHPAGAERHATVLATWRESRPVILKLPKGLASQIETLGYQTIGEVADNLTGRIASCKGVGAGAIVKAEAALARVWREINEQLFPPAHAKPIVLDAKLDKFRDEGYCIGRRGEKLIVPGLVDEPPGHPYHVAYLDGWVRGSEEFQQENRTDEPPEIDFDLPQLDDAEPGDVAAYAAGCDAAIDGKPVNTNPHERGTRLWRCWDHGWQQTDVEEEADVANDPGIVDEFEEI